jgi:hypothetical protein
MTWRQYQHNCFAHGPGQHLEPVNLPLSALGNPTTIGDLVWQDTSGHAQPAFYIDHISLAADYTPAQPKIILRTDSSTHSGSVFGGRFSP